MCADFNDYGTIEERHTGHHHTIRQIKWMKWTSSSDFRQAKACPRQQHSPIRIMCYYSWVQAAFSCSSLGVVVVAIAVAAAAACLSFVRTFCWTFLLRLDYLLWCCWFMCFKLFIRTDFNISFILWPSLLSLTQCSCWKVAGRWCVWWWLCRRRYTITSSSTHCVSASASANATKFCWITLDFNTKHSFWF